MTDLLQARATVQVTLEIDTDGGGWGKDCTVDQVFRQASASAVGRLRQLLEGTTTTRTGCKVSTQGIRVVGTPKICAVMMDDRPLPRAAVAAGPGAVEHTTDCQYRTHVTGTGDDMPCTCRAKVIQ